MFIATRTEHSFPKSSRLISRRYKFKYINLYTQPLTICYKTFLMLQFFKTMEMNSSQRQKIN